MKITVKDFHNNAVRLSCLLMLGGCVLSGCAPMPQAYPTMPPQQQQPQPQRWVNKVPQAAPLLPEKKQAGTARRYGLPPVQQRPQRVQRPAQKTQAARTTVPPTLQPAQRQARPVAASNPVTRQAQQQGQASRRAPVGTYRPQTVRKAPPAIAPVKKAPVKQRVTPPVTKKPVSKTRPVPPSVQARPQSQPRVTVQKKVPGVEVLDMSSAAKQPAGKPVVEKVVPPPAFYQSNPAVVILTKQANNQLVAGKKAQAASTLERALRIAPDNPMLWLRLAEVNEQQGNKVQAASMAKKAMRLAPNDAGIKQRGSRLIN